MEKLNMDLWVLFKTNIMGGVYTRWSFQYNVLTYEAPINNQGGGSPLITRLLLLENQSTQFLWPPFPQLPYGRLLCPTIQSDQYQAHCYGSWTLTRRRGTNPVREPQLRPILNRRDRTPQGHRSNYVSWGDRRYRPIRTTSWPPTDRCSWKLRPGTPEITPITTWSCSTYAAVPSNKKELPG